MKVGLIGFGYWGGRLARCFNELGVLSAISDCDNTNLSKAAKKIEGGKC